MSVFEMVPEFRRDDVWIPAFAGMTFSEVPFIFSYVGVWRDNLEADKSSRHLWFVQSIFQNGSSRL